MATCIQLLAIHQPAPALSVNRNAIPYEFISVEKNLECITGPLEESSSRPVPSGCMHTGATNSKSLVTIARKLSGPALSGLTNTTGSFDSETISPNLYLQLIWLSMWTAGP